jgi:hypothetical protein
MAWIMNEHPLARRTRDKRKNYFTRPGEQAGNLIDEAIQDARNEEDQAITVVVSI